MEKKQEQEVSTENEILLGNKKVEPETTKVTIVDFTSFGIRGEEIFFRKTSDEIRFHLLERCSTVVIHKTTEYEMIIHSKVETDVNKPVEVSSVYEENTFALLKARRYIEKVAKSVVNKRTMGKLMKESTKLDDIIMHEKLD